MISEINVYCDESCHLEHEKENVMLVSCIFTPQLKVKQIANDLRALKEKYNILKRAELKWHKISNNKKQYYFDLIHYFVNAPELKFRTVIIPHKEKLQHHIYHQTHSSWYYKMVYTLVKHIPEYIIKSNARYNVYIDKKENSYESKQELIKLGVCLNSHFHNNFKVQNIVSDQSELMQLNDFIQGAVGYYNRGLCQNIKEQNQTKIEIVQLLQEKLDICLNRTNSLDKFNILVWEADKIG